VEFFDSVVDRDSALRQPGLERELTDFRQTTRLRKRQPLLLEQGQREFLP